MKYVYKAANKSGDTVEGIIEAADKKVVLGMLRSKSLYLLSLSEENPKTSMEINFGSAKIPKKVLAVFCTQLSSILKAGVPLIQALSIMNEQIENKKLRKIVQTVCDELQRGKGLSAAFSEHEKALPTIMIKMIEAGEISGTLDLSLKRLAEHFHKEYKLTQKIKSAMHYPVIIMCVTALIVIFLMTFVVPRFRQFFMSGNIQLPGITRVLLAISDAFTHGWMYILGGILLIYVFWHVFKSSELGRMMIDSRKLKGSIVGKSGTRILAARFSRTLSTLTSSGISLTQSLRITAKVVSNKMAEVKLLEAEEKIREGKTLHTSISETSIFPSMTKHMIKIGEESGTLDEMLDKSAEYFEEEADIAVTKLTSFLQPALLIFVAAIVLFIILSIMAPIMTMYTSI